MEATRRESLGRAAAGATAFDVMPLSLDSTVRAFADTTPPSDEAWDLTWVNKLTGKHKALFDCAEVESGYGVWRASLWGRQYMDVLKAQPKDISTIVVMRHNGIVLAMQQAFWDKYGIGKEKGVKHPITQEITD